MKREIAELWTTALRSGQYVQGRGRLRTPNDEFCCLGVLCDIAGSYGVGEWHLNEHGQPAFLSTDDEFSLGTTVLPPSVVRWAGMNSHNGTYMPSKSSKSCLSSQNDTGSTFEEIAYQIECHQGEL